MRTFRTLFSAWCISLVAGCIFELIPGYAHAQTSEELGRIDVEGRPYGQEMIGPYNQPRWSARGRFSADTDVYVLPPFSFYLDLDYHGTFPRNGKSDQLFTQEFELGLPYRVQVAFELNQERQDGRTQVPFATIEARWAPANWGKIPLNPTFFAEYDFGIGKQYPVQPGANKEQDAPDETGSLGVGDAVREQTTKNIADAYELRLLLGQEIGKYIEFAGNIFFDQDLEVDREREIGFSTAFSYAIRGETLKVGLETSATSRSQAGGVTPKMSSSLVLHSRSSRALTQGLTWRPWSEPRTTPRTWTCF